MCIPVLLPANPGFKRFFCKVKEKVLNSCVSVQRGPVQERSDPGVVDNVTAASRGVRVVSDDGRPNRASCNDESTPTVARTVPEALSVNVNHDFSPSPMSCAAAQDHYGRSPPVIGVSPHPSILPPLRGDVATTTHHIYPLYTPREGVLHVPHPHQRMVVVMTDNDFSSSSDPGSNMFQHGYSQSLSRDSPSPCPYPHQRGGITRRTISPMEDVSFVAIPVVYGEDTLFHRTTSPVHGLPSCSSALHSTNGRPCVFPPIGQHDTHSYFDDGESLQSYPSPVIWAAPPRACGAHPGPSHTPPPASHQLQSTCGCDTCFPRILRASNVGSSRILPQLPSRSYSTGSLGSRFASPRLARSRSVLVASTLPFSPPPAPSTTRSDPPSRRDDSETTAEADNEKLH